MTVGLKTPDAVPLDRWLPYIYFQPEIIRYLEVVSLIGAKATVLEPRISVIKEDLVEARRVVPSLPDRNYVLGRKGDEKTVGREKIVQSERKKTHIRRTIMNAFDLLLDQWTQQVKEIFPALHHSQQQSIAFCVQGIIQSGNAVMQRVAEAVWEHSSSETKMVSHERRFQRFVANERIEVESCWNSFLQ